MSEPDRANYAPAAVESQLAEVWMETLGRTSLQREDDFFELGGDSLKATTLMTHIAEVFGVDLDPIEVFDRPVFADFLAFLQLVSVPDQEELLEEAF